jgi:hypothetical protein
LTQQQSACTAWWRTTGPLTQHAPHPSHV